MSLIEIDDDQGPEIEFDTGLAEYWTEQSLLHYFDHARAAHMLWGACNNMGVTMSECVRIARQETVQRFAMNYVGWSEDQINAAIDNYLMG